MPESRLAATQGGMQMHQVRRDHRVPQLGCSPFWRKHPLEAPPDLWRGLERSSGEHWSTLGKETSDLHAKGHASTFIYTTIYIEDHPIEHTFSVSVPLNRHRRPVDHHRENAAVAPP